jgi:hypothetical protein
MADRDQCTMVYANHSVTSRRVNGSSEAGEHSRSAEKLGERPSHAIKEIITLQTWEFVPARIFAGSDSHNVGRQWK